MRVGVERSTERVPGTFSLWECQSHPGPLLSLSSTRAPDTGVIATWHVPVAFSVGQVMSAMLSEMLKIKGWRGGYVWKEVGGAHGCLRRGGGVWGLLCRPGCSVGCFPGKVTGGHFRWPVAVRRFFRPLWPGGVDEAKGLGYLNET